MKEKQKKQNVEKGVLRPPSESKSLLIRVVRNCPWNKCKFCPAYKGEKFSIRTQEEVLEEIKILAMNPENHQYHSAFLQDGDALSMGVLELEAVIHELKRCFPNLKRITAYSRSNMLLNRSGDDLKKLKNAGLDRIHVGLESGCNEVLEFMNKGTTFQKQKEACLKVKEAGMEICCYVMPGLGGKVYSEKNAIDTGRLLKEIEPNHIRLRTCFVLEGTPLADELAHQRFVPLDDEETVAEIKLLLKQLENTHTEILSDHRMNLLLELNGKLPEQFGDLMKIIDTFSCLEPDKKKQFIVGRRLNIIKKLEELNWKEKIQEIELRKMDYQEIIPVPQTMLF